MTSLNNHQSARGMAAIAAAAALAQIDGTQWDALDVITLAEWILVEEPEPLPDWATDLRVTHVTDFEGVLWERGASTETCSLWCHTAGSGGLVWCSSSELNAMHGPITPVTDNPEPESEKPAPSRRVTRVADRDGSQWERVAEDGWKLLNFEHSYVFTMAELTKYGPLTPVADEPGPPLPNWAIDGTTYVTDVNGTEWQREDLDLWAPRDSNTPVEAFRTTAELVEKFGPITPNKEN